MTRKYGAASRVPTIFPGWRSNRDRAGDWLQVARARKRMTILMHTCGVLLTARQLRSRTSDPALQRGLSGAFLLKKHSIFSLHFVTSAIQRTVQGVSMILRVSSRMKFSGFIRIGMIFHAGFPTSSAMKILQQKLHGALGLMRQQI